MRTFLSGFSIKGIKNIEKKISLEFLKTEPKNLNDFKEANIKAIYGPNGSGKTAIIEGFNILKQLLLDDWFLSDYNNLNYLSKLFNKNSQFLEISLDFYYFDDKQILGQYYYDVSILNYDNNFVIHSEKYSFRQHLKKQQKIIFESLNGKIIKSLFDDETSNKFFNLLSRISFSSVILEYESRADFKVVEPLHFCLTNTIVFVTNEPNEVLYGFKSDVRDNLLRDNSRLFLENNKGSKTYTEKEIELIETKIKNITKYLKLFKYDLLNVELNKVKVFEGYGEIRYTLNTLLVYREYKIDLEYESDGIKKLFNLYSAINDLSSGATLIIDELDSHINDVYLVKLIEYVAKYAKGQLVFTTHNVSPMDVLKHKKNAIDFMSIEGEIIPWRQVGNYKPANLYHRGMIGGLPFNIEAESFVGVFDDE